MSVKSGLHDSAASPFLVRKDTMTKFHINSETGEPGECSARLGNCPYAGDDEHFTSKEAARKHFEATQGAAAQEGVSKFGARKARRAAKFAATRKGLWQENPETVTPEVLKNASAFAEINNRYVPVGHYLNQPKTRFDANPWEFDSDGEMFQTIQERHALMATPDGSFVTATYVAYIEGEDDGYWNFHPGLEVNYTYSESPEEAAESFNKRQIGQNRIPLDYDDELRVTTGNFSRPSYDNSDPSNVANAAMGLARAHFEPDVVAKIAVLRESKAKVTAETLMSSDYFGSPSPELRAVVVRRKEFPKEAQPQALADKDPRVRMAFALRPDLTRESVDALLAQDDRRQHGDGSSTPRSWLLSGPGLPVGMMRKIAREGSLEDMKTLARNPNLSEAAKETLIKRAAQLKINLGLR